jgi:hypothetical protein
LKGGKLRVKASDAGGVKASFVQVGNRAPKIYKRAMKVARTGTIRVWSTDNAGNTERKRTVKR